MTNANAALSSEDMVNIDNDAGEWESSTPIYRSPKTNLMPGDVVQGTFIKAEENKYKGFNYLLRTTQGVEVINGCGSLTKAFEASQPRPGDTLRITYEGKITLTKGDYKGTDAHQYKLAVKRQR